MSAIEHKIKLSTLIKILKFKCHNKETNHFNVAESLRVLLSLGLLNSKNIEPDLIQTQNLFASQAGLDINHGQ